MHPLREPTQPYPVWADYAFNGLIFWSWLRGQVDAAMYSQLRTQPLGFMQQLYAATWYPHIRELFDQDFQRWLETTQSTLREAFLQQAWRVDA